MHVHVHCETQGVLFGYPITTLRIEQSLVTNGISHNYHLDESSFILGATGIFFSFFDLFSKAQAGTPRLSYNFHFLFHFSMKIISANRKVPDGMLRRSHKKDTRLKRVKSVHFSLRTGTLSSLVLYGTL